jgi:hypothetical protein
MLRRISTVAAAAAMLGISALPAAAATTHAAHASKGSFTVPASSSSIKAWGTFQDTTLHKANVVKVTMCAKLTGSAFFVIAEAYGYTASGIQLGAVSAAVGQETPGHQDCGTAYLRGTAHLKVFSETFQAQSKAGPKKSSVKSIY